MERRKPKHGEARVFRGRIYYCPRCGHLEWIDDDGELPDDYHCPLCSAQRGAMVMLGSARSRNFSIAADVVSTSVLRISEPRMPPLYRHYGYVLRHPEGDILFDAPPFFSDEAVAYLRTLASPVALVVSHQDFVGSAQLWADALDVPVYMGSGEFPLSGNRLDVDCRVSGASELLPGVQVTPVPGHSNGSIAVYWDHAPEGPVLLAGDALCVWPHEDGRRQVAFFQNPPVADTTRRIASAPIAVLATCTGALTGAGPVMHELLSMHDCCAAPYRGDRGGVWIDPSR